MDSDSESDVETADFTTINELDSMISETDAKVNYEEAGRLVPEEKDHISIDQHPEIMDSPLISQVLSKILGDLALPYNLSDFQKLALHTLLQKKDLIVISPTGSGKESNFTNYAEKIKI